LIEAKRMAYSKETPARTAKVQAVDGIVPDSKRFKLILPAAARNRVVVRYLGSAQSIIPNQLLV
jgi:hypothetical protein